VERKLQGASGKRIKSAFNITKCAHKSYSDFPNTQMSHWRYCCLQISHSFLDVKGSTLSFFQKGVGKPIRALSIIQMCETLPAAQTSCKER